METYEGRLASFSASSSSKKSASRWPHPASFSVTPALLAAAGFYFDPVKGIKDSDNASCVYCAKGLEGWEEGDDALSEHLKRAIDRDTDDRCPWATVVSEKSKKSSKRLDPHSDKMRTARKGTFGSWWKYDGKKGWRPTSDRLTDAGFYNNPLPDAPDTCACVYCDVQLDGWSKNDDPEQEHLDRNPDCYFFTSRTSSKKASKVLRESVAASAKGNAASAAAKPAKKSTKSSSKRSGLQKTHSTASLPIAEADENDEPAESQHTAADSDAESIAQAASQPKRKAASKSKKSVAASEPGEEVVAKVSRKSRAIGGKSKKASVAPSEAAPPAVAEESESDAPEASQKSTSRGSKSGPNPEPAASQGKGKKRGKKASLSAESAAEANDIPSIPSADAAAPGTLDEDDPIEEVVETKGLTRSSRSKDLADSQGSSQGSKKGAKKSSAKTIAAIEVDTDAEGSQPIVRSRNSQTIEVVIPVVAKKVGTKAVAKQAEVSEAVTDAGGEVSAAEEADLPKPKAKTARAKGASKASKASTTTKSRTRAGKASSAASAATSAAETESEAEPVIVPVRNGQPSIVRKQLAKPSVAPTRKVKRGRRIVEDEEETDSELPTDDNEDAASVADLDLSRVTASTRQYEGDEDITRDTVGASEEDQEDVPTPKAKSATSGSGKSRSGMSTKSGSAGELKPVRSARTRAQSQSSSVAPDESTATASDAESIADEHHKQNESAIVVAAKARPQCASKGGKKATSSGKRVGKSEAKLSRAAVQSEDESMASDSASTIAEENEIAPQHPVAASLKPIEQDQAVQEIADLEVLISPPRQPDTAPVEELEQTVRRPVAPVAEPVVPAKAVVQVQQEQPVRNVKALPKRKSSVLPPVKPIEKGAVVVNAQSALDALLAGPIPTFDTPARPAAAPVSPARGSTPTAQASEVEEKLYNSLGLKPLPVLPLTKQEEAMPAKQWLKRDTDIRLEHLERELEKVLAEFDRRASLTRTEMERILTSPRA